MSGAGPARWLALAALGAVLGPWAAVSAQGGGPLEGAAEVHWKRVAEPDADTRRQALEALLTRPEAARAGLEGALSGDRPALQRRAAARWLRLAGDGADLERVLHLAADPDPWVRREAAGFLGRSDLGSAGLERRVEALAGLARLDPEPDLRDVAVDLLGRLDRPQAAEALGVLLLSLPADEQLAAAEALVAQVRGGAVLELFLRADVPRPPALAAAGPRRLSPAAHGALLTGYGRRLAESGPAAHLPAARGPILAGLRHPAPEVRAGAEAGVSEALARWAWLERPQEALRFLEDLAREAPDEGGRALGRARFALASLGDAELALMALAPFAADGRPEGRAAAREDLLRAALFEAAALFALERHGAALESLERGRALAAELRRERRELDREGAGARRAETVRAVEAEALAGLVEVWALARHLALGGSPGDGEARALARAAHRSALRAQITDLRYGARWLGGSFDDLLERELGPRHLLGLDEVHPNWPRSRWLDLQQDLLTALALAAPAELPGLLTDELRAEADDVLADPDRLELLRELRLAEIEVVQVRAARDRANRRIWEAVLGQLREQIAADAAGDSASLLRYRSPTSAALSLAHDRRGDGDPEGALELALGMRADLEGAIGSMSAIWRGWVMARLGLAAGAALTDLGRAEEAEAELLGSLSRLDVLERELGERLEALLAGRGAPQWIDEPDAQRRRQLRAQIEQTRGLRADAYVSLAVNANVRLGDAERALEFFERGFELRRNDFTVVLLACYRARAGRGEEARLLLADVPEAPPLFYNLACTWALLGESERALDYLERALAEGVRSPGARARQREWARDDPDLAPLRGLERFEALTAP